MLMTIDAGNSRVKLALWNDDGIVHRDSAPYNKQSPELDGLLDAAKATSPASSIVVSNVGPQTVAQAIDSWSRANQQPPAVYLKTSRACCGIEHAYADPSQHGVDRWAALIAASHLYEGAVCVVDAGTAITFDVLDNNKHRGGLIFPGFDLMLDSMISILPAVQPQPPMVLADNTGSAITGGCQQALEGGIDSVLRSVRDQLGAGFTAVFTGGQGEELCRQMSAEHDCLFEPDLVMHGLKRYVEWS